MVHLFILFLMLDENEIGGHDDFSYFCKIFMAPMSATIDASKYALVDLHLHLDGSLTPEDILTMARLGGNEAALPSTDPTELKNLLTCPPGTNNLVEYLKCFDLPIDMMQSHEPIAYSAYSLVKRLAAQGIIYSEIRFAPLQHTYRGISQDEVVRAAIEGLQQGMRECPEIKANFILCCMRGRKDELNYETIRLAKKYLGKGAVAIDLVGAEALYPTSDYKAYFEYASSLGIPFTIHAGEADGAISISCALDYGASRIAHGIRCFKHPDLMRRIKDMGVCLDICPKSNLDTHAIKGVERMEDYPLKTILDAGVEVTINVDNLSVSDSSLVKEYDRLFSAGILTESQARAAVECAITHAFISESEKEELLRKARSRMGD